MWDVRVIDIDINVNNNATILNYINNRPDCISFDTGKKWPEKGVPVNSLLTIENVQYKKSKTYFNR